MSWDMWIECNMNKGSKVKARWLTILQNEKQLLVHSRNVNNVAKIQASLNALANRKETKTKHAECGPKRIREDEQCVQGLAACKRFTFSRKPDMENPGEVLKGKAVEIEQSAFKAVIDLAEVSELVELSELLEDRVVEVCFAYSTPMAPTWKHRRAHLCRSSLCNP